MSAFIIKKGSKKGLKKINKQSKTKFKEDIMNIKALLASS
jgi:hypothetical protein